MFGRSAFFGRIGETSHAVELSFADKLFEFLKLSFGLAGIADDECGSYADIRKLCAEGVEQTEGAFAVDTALHRGEDTAVDMLQGDVDIVADVVVTADDIDGIGGERGGVGVVQAYPTGTAFGS